MHTFQMMTRRNALLGAACALGGCSTLTSLNAASEPLDTYDLLPAAASTTGRRSSRTLLVPLPQAPGALATDRIVIKPRPAAITYLPDARWTDELPAVVQSLLIRTVSQSGRIAYVGAADGGPVPDRALLVRIDVFEALADETGAFDVQVDMNLTLINDSSQRVIAAQRFAQSVRTPAETPPEIVAAFQTVLDVLLPAIGDWVLQRV